MLTHSDFIYILWEYTYIRCKPPVVKLNSSYHDEFLISDRLCSSHHIMKISTWQSQTDDNVPGIKLLLCLPKAELNTKNSTKRQLCCCLVEFLVFNSIYQLSGTICNAYCRQVVKELYERSLWFECLHFTLCYLDFFLTLYDLCHLLWWAVGW